MQITKSKKTLDRFFRARIIALVKKYGRLRPNAIGTSLRRVVAKCADSKVSDEQQEFFWKNPSWIWHSQRSRTAHFFQNIIGMPSPKTHYLLNFDFRNAFKYLNRETMSKNVHFIKPSVVSFAFAAYSKPGFLIYGDIVVSSEVGTQQGHPEAPLIFAEII